MTDPIRGIICGVVGLAIVIFVIRSLIVGKIGYHGHVAGRSDNPILYWVRVIAFCGFGIYLSYLAIHYFRR